MHLGDFYLYPLITYKLSTTLIDMLSHLAEFVSFLSFCCYLLCFTPEKGGKPLSLLEGHKQDHSNFRVQP